MLWWNTQRFDLSTEFYYRRIFRINYVLNFICFVIFIKKQNYSSRYKTCQYYVYKQQTRSYKTDRF